MSEHCMSAEGHKRLAAPRARRGSGGVLSLCLALALLGAIGCDRTAAPPAAPPAGPDQPQRLPTAAIKVGAVPLAVEVAREKEQQAKGMMFRRSLGPDEAMLFVSDRDTNLAFWMKNTYVDLDLAYIRSDGTVLQIERMKAFNPEAVFSREPARFALEAPAGWFAAHGIEVGAKVEIPADVARPKE
jgi:hypothetical protein